MTLVATVLDTKVLTGLPRATTDDQDHSTRDQKKHGHLLVGLQQAAEGPKWETDDGRVVQKIWQQAGCFDIGNTFLIEKMELTTGRLIVIIDKNVWDLYGYKISGWCAHNDLELEAVVRPGNEDQKTMDNCLAVRFTLINGSSLSSFFILFVVI